MRSAIRRLGFSDFEDMVREAAARDDRVVLGPRVDAGQMARAPVLVWRNATRMRLINAFRVAHGAPPDALLPGEPLICDGIELPLKHRRRRMDLEARGLIKGAQVIYLGPGARAGFARLHVVGAEEPRVGVASIIQIESPDREEPEIVVGREHGGGVPPRRGGDDPQGAGLAVVGRAGVRARHLGGGAVRDATRRGCRSWKRLAYVAVTRAEERLHWITRYALGRPTAPLGTEDLLARRRY